jgi:hypothetical protein
MPQALARQKLHHSISDVDDIDSFIASIRKQRKSVIPTPVTRYKMYTSPTRDPVARLASDERMGALNAALNSSARRDMHDDNAHAKYASRARLEAAKEQLRRQRQIQSSETTGRLEKSSTSSPTAEPSHAFLSMDDTENGNDNSAINLSAASSSGLPLTGLRKETVDKGLKHPLLRSLLGHLRAEVEASSNSSRRNIEVTGTGAGTRQQSPSHRSARESTLRVPAVAAEQKFSARLQRLSNRLHDPRPFSPNPHLSAQQHAPLGWSTTVRHSHGPENHHHHHHHDPLPLPLPLSPLNSSAAQDISVDDAYALIHNISTRRQQLYLLSPFRSP